MNRCQRCNRELSDPYANYGWRCAEILGVDNFNGNLSREYKIALENSIEKTENMIKGSNINLSTNNSKVFFNSLLKQNFLNNIGRYDLEKKERERGLKILTTGRTVGKESPFFEWIKGFDSGYEVEEKTEGSKERTIEFALDHPIIALNIGQFKSGSTNITTNAVRFSTNDLGLKESSSKEGSQVNAFRHVLWQATITKRYGPEIAREVGFAHEENPDALGGKYSEKDFKDVEFKTSADADQACDLLNNVQGRIVGRTTESEKMNRIALDVIDRYYTEGFWISEYTEKGTYKISKKKLSEKQYKTAKKRLELLDSDGYTKEQREGK